MAMSCCSNTPALPWTTFERGTFVRVPFIRTMWSGCGTNAGRRLHAGSHLRNGTTSAPERRTVSVVSHPLSTTVLDGQGHVIRWYATGTDIDDRKRDEERIQKKTWRCAKRSITRRCLKKSSVRRKRSAKSAGTSRESGAVGFHGARAG